ncbi:MAG: hypothetical protein K9J12_12260 [Melioribacteraceae bacterium]|nr:hypothetical protein [Melioribacteraceae bacterium]MCF8263744.1 hypothetical protein [Melioribacteraceae bacterium]MCF8412675.1 hypothetical protein [Melioribacteraceae bacterium]MCF8430979.1 hypothetical protein [Melioribacteraceae bacterium]
MAENLGEVMEKKVADEKFGEVLESGLLDSTEIESAIEQTESILMFSIFEKKAIILGNKRKVIYPKSEIIPKEFRFMVYSTDKVQELLNLGGEKFTLVEIRKKVITLSNGNFTLEFGLGCPPFCP